MISAHADQPTLVIEAGRAERHYWRDLWRYRELLPVNHAENIVSLGETMTPLLAAPRLAKAMGVKQLLIKDEGRLPSGSFKARGMALAISKAKELGVRRVAVPTAGNAGGAMAACKASKASTV